jgi:hypothetical protein
MPLIKNRGIDTGLKKKEKSNLPFCGHPWASIGDTWISIIVL